MRGSNLDPRIQEVIESINGSVQADLSVGEMAESVNLSLSRFQHLFKLHTGDSPASYRRKRRMARATQLLETTWIKIKDIAAAVGLNDSSHFVRDFKQLYGVSPTQYRNNCRRRQRKQGKSGQ